MKKIIVFFLGLVVFSMQTFCMYDYKKKLEEQYENPQYDWEKRQAALQLVNIYKQDGNQAKAKEWVGKLKKMYKEIYRNSQYNYQRCDAAVDLGDVYAQESNDRKAVEWYENALKQRYINENKPQEVRLKIKTIQDKQVDDTFGAYNELIQKGQTAQAIQVLEKIYNNTALLSTTKISAALKLGNLYNKEKNDKNALEWYGKAIKLPIHEFYAPRQEAINVLKNKARQLLEQGKLDEAIAVYEYGEESKKELIEGLGEVELPGIFGNDIKQIKKIAGNMDYKKKFLEAIKQKEQSNFEAARTLFESLINDRLTIVTLFLNELPKKAVGSELKEWIKLMQLEQNTWAKDKDLRIEGGWLEVNKQVGVYLLGITLDDLIQDQFKEELPCLITIAEAANGDHIIFDTTFLGEQILTSGDSTIKDVGSIQKTFTFAIARGDSAFILIKETSNDTALIKFLIPMFKKETKVTKNEYGSRDNIALYTLREEWATKGQAQFEIAKILEQEAKYLEQENKKDALRVAYRWYKYAYDLLPEGNLQDKALKTLNEVGESIRELAFMPKKPKKPIIIEKPRGPEDNDLQKSFMQLQQALMRLHARL